MSHELRTPLNGILGHAALLRTDKTLSDRQSAGINVIQQSGEHLLRLINDVLNLAKIEAGKLELSLSDVALEKFLRSIASIVSIKAELKRLTFSLQLEPGLPAGIRVDEQRLRQVLLNLLANAITFTDRGSVCLRVCALSDTNLRFEVRDTGIGISAHHLDAIFQPFEQVADNQHRAGGTGLGLPISQKYVRLMGSQIEVESQPGQGSTFRFDLELPVVSTAAVAEEETAARDVARPAWTIEPLITPPAPELADLHHLAQQGNMRDIVSWARRVIELDGRRYGSFADHVRRLAESYESQAILTLVREHLRKEVRT
jgi:signal transduction histidine kinase